MPTASATRALLHDLNPAQRAAAAAVRGPVRILAGAGSGKTRTITHRIAHQIATGTARPDEILAVTFTDKAAAELRTRLAALLGGGRPVRAATFHSAAWAQLRYFWPRVHDAPLPEVVSSKVRLLVAPARRLGVEARDLAAEIEWAKARLLAPEDYADAAPGRGGPVDTTTMARVYAAYERDNRAAGRIDFDDMIALTTRLLSDHPELAAEVRERYRFFTVDEFQDTNPAQWTLLRTWLGDGDDLCVVGDDDQMIYSFAGASARYLVDFPRTFPDATLVTLADNYRSTRQIVELANRVLWTKPSSTRKRLVSRCGDGPEPVFREHADDDEEVAAAVAEVLRLRRAGVAPGEIAIAYRTNSQSEPFEQALRDAGVPYVVRGDTGFFQRAEVRQALAALSAAGEDPDGAARSGDAAPPVAGAEPAGPPRLDRQVEAVLRDALSWHPRREPQGEAARERWRNLGVLVGLATTAAEADPGTTLAGFCADLRARAATGADSADPAGAVTLLSLHRAKGLEFDAVLLVALEEGLLPISYAKDDDAVEEERRLFYVGVTRARRHLWLSWARSRTTPRGRAVGRRPSRFLYGLGDGAPQAQPKGQATRSVQTCACGRPLIAAAERRAGRCDACADAAVDPDLAERLRAWRRERAGDDGVPAYVVFSDRTLRDLAGRRPTSPAELLAVHGFGPTKVTRYGADVLRVIGGG